MKREAYLKQSVLIILIALGLTSCLGIVCINGNGIFVTVERGETGFDGIANSTSADIYYSKGDEYSVIIEADENLAEYIHTSVSSGILEIELKGTRCIRPGRTPVVYITSPVMSEIVLSGSGDIFADTLSGYIIDILDSGSGDIICSYIEGDEAELLNSGAGDITVREIYADETRIVISGSGDISAEGIVENSDITSTGAGQAYCDDLTTTVCNALLSGSGNVHISVMDELIATLTGSGNLYYTGNPEIHKNITGSGRVINVNK